MGYIGNQQAEGFVQRPTKQDLTGATGDTLTLTHAVSKEEDIDLYINNVKQEPTTAYTVADTAVTLTGSVVASDDIYVVYNSLALQTVVPPDGSVTNAKLASGAAASNLGTSVNLATIKDSTGTNTAMTVASNGVVTQNQLPLFYAHDVTNFAGASGWKSLNWTTKEETHKIDWDSTNYRIKPTIAGYYQIIFNHAHTGGSHTEYALRIEHSNYGRIANHEGAGSRQSISVVEYFDGSTDYITTDTYHSNANHAEDNTDRRCNIGMFLVKGD